MAHFAELDDLNRVLRVIVVADELELDGENWCHNFIGGFWKQTSYNGTMRKNYAGIGYTYDSMRDAFIAPEPAGAIGFDESTCQWVMPPVG